MDHGSQSDRLALRRLALRALSSPLPAPATTAPVRSIATTRAPRFRPAQPSVLAHVQRRWLADDVQRSPDDAAAAAPEAVAEDPTESMLAESSTAEYTDSPPEPTQSSQRSAIVRSRDQATLPPTSTLYVGNLFYDITEADLRREFEKIGEVKSINIQFDRRGLSKGHAYVEYSTIEDAQRAIAELNQQVFEGRRMVVNFRAPPTVSRPSFRTASPAEPTRTLFIGNMSYEMTDQDLNGLFRDVRNVIDVRVAIDRRTGTPKGFAHADFTDVESAQNAARILERKRLYGRQLRIDFSTGSRILSDENKATSEPREPFQD